MAFTSAAGQHQHALTSMKTKVVTAHSPRNDTRCALDQCTASSPVACTGHLLDLLASGARPSSPSAENLEMLLTTIPACKQDRSPIAASERGPTR